MKKKTFKLIVLISGITISFLIGLSIKNNRSSVTNEETHSSHERTVNNYQVKYDLSFFKPI